MANGRADYDVIVIGGGPGGYAAAFRAADLGKRTAIVDMDARLGGVCLLRGCIPSKALLHAAHTIHLAQEAADWGLTYAKPHLNLDKLREKKESVVNKLSGGVHTLAKARKVDFIHGKASFENANTLRLLANGEIRFLTFDKLIIATGSRPVVPAALRLDDERWMDSSRALDLPFVPGRLLVIGGGYIGMELGTVYAALGSEVVVVEALDRILAATDADLVRPVEKRARGMFADILLKTRVDEMRSEDDGIFVRLSPEDGESREERFDGVLVSIGRRPNSDGLELGNTRVQCNDRGFIIADEQCRTAEPHIFAIGDVAGDPMLAHKASHEGLVAAEVIAGEPSAFEPQAIPAVVFTDPEIAWAGLTETEAKVRGIPVTVAKFPWAASGRATTLARNDGVTKLVCEPGTGRVLGVGITGSGAGELIAEGVLAIEMGAVAEDLARSIHPHPTLSETVMESAELFGGSATHYMKR